MTEEEYNIIQDNIEEIEQIVHSHSMYKLTPSLRDKIVEMGKKYRYISCNSCAGAVYAGVVHLYEDYLKVKKDKNGKKIRQRRSTGGVAKVD